MNRDDNERPDPMIERILPFLKQAPPDDLPADFADRIVAAALTERSPRPSRGALSRLADSVRGLLKPRAIVIRPAWQFAGALLLCLMSSAGTMWLQEDERAAPSDVLVRFAVQAPEAHTVSLAGDFNGWETGDIPLSDPDGDGVWQAVVPLTPGVYQYMFVLDDARWIPDPTSPDRIDDGFGRTNSLLHISNYAASKTEASRRAS